MHVNNRMFAYYDQTFHLIFPITDRYIIIYMYTAATILKYGVYHTTKSPYHYHY